MTNIFIIVSALAGGLLLGYFIRQTLAQRQANSIEAKLKERIEKVKEEAKQIILEAKEKADKIIEDARIDEKIEKVR